MQKKCWYIQFKFKNFSITFGKKNEVGIFKNIKSYMEKIYKEDNLESKSLSTVTR